MYALNNTPVRFGVSFPPGTFSRNKTKDALNALMQKQGISASVTLGVVKVGKAEMQGILIRTEEESTAQQIKTDLLVKKGDDFYFGDFPVEVFTVGRMTQD